MRENAIIFVGSEAFLIKKGVTVATYTIINDFEFDQKQGIIHNLHII